MEKKITKREVINAMLADVAIKGNAIYVAYLENELALLNKKSATKSKANAEKEKKDADLKAIVLDVLGAMEKGTVSEIAIADERLALSAGVSPQKVTNILYSLIADGKVVRADGKKAIFSLA